MHPAPESVLVLRFSAAGDLVLTSPALEALKRAWPKTRLVVATKRVFAELIRHDPHVDEVVALEPGEGVVRFARRLSQRQPEVVLDLHAKARSAALRALVAHRRGVVWQKRGTLESAAVRLGWKTYRAGALIAERYQRAVDALVGELVPRGQLRYVVGPAEQAEADRVLSEAGVALDRPILGIAPGANWETKRWPADRYGGLAQRALERGVQVVLTGSVAEAEVAKRVQSLAPAAHDLIGKIPLSSLGGVITRCTAVVANDSAPMHIARGLGVPTLAIFGSTDPGQFDFSGHALLFAGVDCAPCHFYGRRRCPRGHFRCMVDLELERAWTALQPLLAGGRRELVRG